MNRNLPEGTELLRTKKPYVNLSKLPEGEHRYRIVGRPIAGWLDWKDNKPYRFRPSEKPKASFDPEKPMKPFWAMHVWDYANEGLYVMEVSQNSIRRALEDYAMNEDWGDLTSYDIKIKKEGSGKDTKYSVIPIPPKPLAKEIQIQVDATQIRLEALYEGKDPWLDLEPSAPSVFDPIEYENLSEEQSASIDMALREFGDKEADMRKFICNRAEVKSVYFIPAEKYDGVMTYLKDQLKKHKGGANERKSA